MKNSLFTVFLLGACSGAAPGTTAPAPAPVPAPAVAPAGTAVAEAPANAAPETCYTISTQKEFWSKTPELLCTQAQADQGHVLSMRTGLTGEREIARFNLDLLERAKCMDCNQDVFGVANPSNSIFNAFKVSFKGERDVNSGAESGQVSIGGTTFFYKTR